MMRLKLQATSTDEASQSQLQLKSAKHAGPRLPSGMRLCALTLGVSALLANGVKAASQGVDLL